MHRDQEPSFRTPTPALLAHPSHTLKRGAEPLSSADHIQYYSDDLRHQHTTPPQYRISPAVGSAGCLSLPTACPLPTLLLLAVLEPAHDASEVQAPCQRVQEHLVLLDALDELLQGQFPWRTEKGSQGEEGALPFPVAWRGAEPMLGEARL